MSGNYKDEDRVPTDVLCKRLDELVQAVTHGSVNREFTMRVPAEKDRDADLVMSEASIRLRKLEETLKDIVDFSDVFIRDYPEEIRDMAKEALGV